jgi:hypothetical protein
VSTVLAGLPNTVRSTCARLTVACRVPNLPLGYTLFRTWSHYRALQGGKHLELLVGKNLISAVPSKAMDEAYVTTQPDEHNDPEQVTHHASKKQEALLVQPHSPELLSEAFKLPGLRIEIERAIEQVQAAITAEKTSMANEKRTASA